MSRRAALALACVTLLAGCAGTAPRAQLIASTPAPGIATIPGGRTAASGPLLRVFSPTSFWYRPVLGSPLDPRSAELMEHFAAQVASDERPGHWPWINTTSSSIPVYTVPRREATTRVKLERVRRAPALQAAWERVPLPPGARPAAGSDKALVLYQPATDRLWDFWRLNRSATGWEASWGGAMRHLSRNQGVYGPRAWPGARSWWGDSASSLEPLGGLITLQDLASGQIDHAIAIAIPNVRAGVYSSPARRTDGRSESPLDLPEGARLRLDPTLDLTALHLPRLALIIARAAQRFGLIIRDYAPVLTLYAQDPTPTGTNPYAGPDGYFENQTPAELLAGFPWNHLRLLPMHLHETR